MEWMKAISVWQPWAQFIVLGWKTIETRTHDRFKSLVGQRIFIHAAGKIDNEDNWVRFLTSIQLYWMKLTLKCTPRLQPSLIGSAFVEDLRPLNKGDSEAALFDCSLPVPRLYGLILKNVYIFDKPIPWKGSQGIFKVEKRICRVCGCTDEDCSACIAATGEPCHWVEEDLCSRCALAREG